MKNPEVKSWETVRTLKEPGSFTSKHYVELIIELRGKYIDTAHRPPSCCSVIEVTCVNEADFLGFCRNRFGIGPLHKISNLRRCWSRQLSDSGSRGVANSPTW
jgi:hypothetical protein